MVFEAVRVVIKRTEFRDENLNLPAHDLTHKATRRLRLMCNHYDCTLDELLAWYADPMDMDDIAKMTRPQVEQSVRFYILDRDCFNHPGMEASETILNLIKNYEAYYGKRDRVEYEQDNQKGGGQQGGS